VRRKVTAGGVNSSAIEEAHAQHLNQKIYINEKSVTPDLVCGRHDQVPVCAAEEAAEGEAD
jgi:hypothetical protein